MSNAISSGTHASPQSEYINSKALPDDKIEVAATTNDDSGDDKDILGTVKKAPWWSYIWVGIPSPLDT